MFQGGAGAAVREDHDANPLPRQDVHFALENDGWNCTFECEVHVSASGTLLDAEDWIVLGVVEGLNPWRDEDHARTQEAPR